MKIAFFCKRDYMHKDVIADRYARLYEIPMQLAVQGHSVAGICLSYRNRDAGLFKHYHQRDGGLYWLSCNLGYFIVPGFANYLRNVWLEIKQFKPDVLLASSDCLHAIIAAGFGKFLAIPLYLDLYDNYESFGLAKVPGLLWLYRRAIKGAKGVCCVSNSLADYIRQRYQHPNVITLESTISGGDFIPLNKQACREKLKLPDQGTLIGIAGALDSSRGIDLLYRSFLQLAESDLLLHLVLAGPTDNACPVPAHPRIHYLGMLAHQDIPVFYNALDLAVICMRDSDFGRYAFPQKTYEILACKTPVLAARVGALAQLFQNYPRCLYQPDSVEDLSTKILDLLAHPESVDLPIPTWAEQAEKLATWLQG